MKSIRSNLQGIVVHQTPDRSLEYGIETGMGHRPVPYCEWNFGTQCGTVVLEWDEDAIVTNEF
ncbi:MAG: hypothetical protein NTY30_04555 [Candidatus Berkelbacteria bacterium]|nr:hypothetical protein [Candidatus Berkelbacteria bacterium]